MVQGESQEGFFWNTHPWVMSEKSGSGGSTESGSEEKSASAKNQLVDSSIDNNETQIKQHEMGSTGGSNGGAQETIATVIGGGSLRNGDAFKTENVDDKKVNNQDNKGNGGVDPTEHELHIWTERERRKKMRNMFHQLHALLPQLSPKADKSTIVDEAVNHIKTLQQTLQKLQRKKRERFHGLSTNTVFQTWTSSNVTLNVCGLDAHISICSPRKPGLVTTICFVLEKHKLDIVSAHISSDQMKIFFVIHAHANTHNQFGESFPYDEVFKQAAAEIMLWVTSKSS
ncbi:hypothetical protein Lser_V15G45823 [Lactuca serriola]